MPNTEETILSEQQMREYQDQLADMPEALEAMEVIKSCGGSLEVAAETMLRGWLESTGALSRHNGDFHAAMSEYLSGIK